MDQEVKTSFILVDEATGPIAQIAKASADLTTHAEQARIATKKIGEMPIPPPGAGPLAQIAAPAAPAEDHESRARQMRAARVGDEQFQIDKEEMLARRGRMRHERLHHQRTQAQARLAEAAMTIMVGSQNELAARLTKFGTGTIAIGTSMAAFGGKTGKVGSMLGKLGTYGEMAAVGLEIGATALELLGVDVDKLTTEIKEGASIVRESMASFLGLATASSKASEKGFRSEADEKAFEAMRKRWESENVLTKAVRAHAERLGAVPIQKIGESVESYHKRLEEAGKDILKFGGDALKDVKPEEVVKALEAAAQSGGESFALAARANAYLTEMVKQAAADVNPPAYKASAEELSRFASDAAEAAAKMVALHRILPEQEAEARKMIEASAEARGTIEASIAQIQTRTEEEDKVEEALKQLILPAFKARSSMQELHETALFAAQALAKSEGFTPKMAEELATKAIAKVDMTKAHHGVHFHNARFDIKQAFAEGFDPDRIAVAFAGDLAKIGEMRTMSGLGPAFSSSR